MWLARLIGEGVRLEERVGISDDTLDSDGIVILDFAQAQEKARQWFLLALRRATGEVPLTKGRGFTVRAAVEEYLEALEHQGKPTRIARYDFESAILPQLGELRVDRLTPARLSAWHAERAATPRRRGRRNADAGQAMTAEEQRRRRVTANRLLTRLKAALNLAVRAGRVSASGRAWGSVKAFAGVTEARAEFLSIEQQGQIVRACDRKDFQELLRAALYSGARLGELARLRVEDVRGSTLYVRRSKAGRRSSPVVFLSGEADGFFSALAKGKEPGELLLQRRDGVAWSKESVKKLMARACFAAGLERITFHQLRHSAASTWLMDGASLFDVARQLGHSSTRMVEAYYGHLSEEHLREKFGSTKLGLDRAARAKPAKVSEIPKRKFS